MINALKNRSCKTRAYNADMRHVQGNLAITPAQMNIMTNKGMPVSAAALSPDLFDDGHLGSDPHVPFELRRGVDFSQVAEYQAECRSKVKSAVESASNGSKD